MTTPRDQIAEVLLTATTDYGMGKTAPEVDLFNYYADVLAPLVDRLRAEAAADALGDVADALGSHDQDIEVALGGAAYVRGFLRDRAAAYRANTGKDHDRD